MPHSRRSGLNVSRVKRADGSVREYFYDAKTKAFLGHDRAAAEARVRGETLAEVPEDSIAGLILRYKGTDKYKKLRPATKDLYDRYLGQIKTGWGDCRAKDIRTKTIEDIKDALQDSPSKCNMILALLRILLRLATRLEYVPSNVAAKPGRIEMPPRTTIWSVDDEQRFLAVARPSLRLGFMLMLYTVQRVSDVLEMEDDRISIRDGRMFVALRQAKTGALLDVPVHRTLEPVIESRLAESERSKRLIGSPREFNWSRRNFARAWDKAIIAAGLTDSGLQRRDLRRTGIVRMAEAGATTPMIAAVSGHSIDYCQSIIDTYLPRRTEVAVAGIELWENAGARANSKVVDLASRRATK